MSYKLEGEHRISTHSFFSSRICILYAESNILQTKIKAQLSMYVVFSLKYIIAFRSKLEDFNCERHYKLFCTRSVCRLKSVQPCMYIIETSQGQLQTNENSTITKT